MSDCALDEVREAEARLIADNYPDNEHGWLDIACDRHVLADAWLTAKTTIDEKRFADIKSIAYQLGYGMPKDVPGCMRILQLIASTAVFWRDEASKYSDSVRLEVEKQKLYGHQQQRLKALAKQTYNLRRALRNFMKKQVAFVHEQKAEMETFYHAFAECLKFVTEQPCKCDGSSEPCTRCRLLKPQWRGVNKVIGADK